MEKKLNLYNKYRPKCFGDFIGQETTKSLLIQSFKKNKNVQSFIFYGSHGIGKTSLARILAKAFNCEQFPEKNDVCNKCKNCTLIEESKTMDVYEVDAASHSGVDNMREIIQNCHYMPLDLNKKIYIIDEAHSLSTAAWNSLLKTIEEPPSENIIFLFLTTNINKIPDTILSRCQKYSFSKFNREELFNLIETVVEKEQKKMEDSAKDLIASLSQGSARECMSLLELIFLNASDHISVSDVERTFSLSNQQDLLNLLDMLVKRDLVACNFLIEEFFITNKNMLNFFSALMAIFMDLYLYENTKNPIIMKKISEEEAKRFMDKNMDFLGILEILEKYTKGYEFTTDKLCWAKILLFRLWDSVSPVQQQPEEKQPEKEIKPVEKKVELVIEQPTKPVEAIPTPPPRPIEKIKEPEIQQNPPEKVELPEICKQFEEKIIYGLHPSHLNKSDSEENFRHFTSFISSNKPSKELLNIFKKIKPIKNQLLTTDKTIVVRFMDEFDVIDFNELMKKEEIQEELENFFLKKYEWLGISQQQLVHYVKVCKNTKTTDIKREIFEKSEENNIFNEVLKILEEK